MMNLIIMLFEVTSRIQQQTDAWVKKSNSFPCRYERNATDARNAVNTGFCNSMKYNRWKFDISKAAPAEIQKKLIFESFDIEKSLIFKTSIFEDIA